MKRSFSRKHRAVRSLVTLLAMLLALQLLNIYNFTPTAALRDKERELGIDKTEILARVPYTDALDVALSAGEDFMLLTEMRCDLFQGWGVDNSWALHRDPTRPIQLKASTTGNEDVTHLWLCGWVADGDLTELKLRIRCRQWYGTDGGDLDVYVTVTDFLDWQGERVFLMISDAIPATYTLREVYLTGEEGELLLQKW